MEKHERLTLRQAVIVEGKYDKIRLEAMVDALILTTDGFRIFRDKDMCTLIRSLAQSCGIVVLTDADAAGFKIRAHVGNIAQGGQVIHVYIPDIWGKERRKVRPSAEHKLGVEGMDTAALRTAFQNAGILPDGSARDTASRITKQDLYEAGLSGGPDSRLLRQRLLERLRLPQRLSANSLLPVLSQMLTREAFWEMVEELKASNG